MFAEPFVLQKQHHGPPTCLQYAKYPFVYFFGSDPPRRFNLLLPFHGLKYCECEDTHHVSATDAFYNNNNIKKINNTIIIIII